jgi:hypothetical protein
MHAGTSERWGDHQLQNASRLTCIVKWRWQHLKSVVVAVKCSAEQVVELRGAS